MKTTRYHLEKVVQSAGVNNVDYLKSELKDVLESNNDYTKKADYIGYSILSIDEKVKLIDEQLSELKEYKSKLKEAKSLALEVGAKVFNEYGISKIEGVGISSITVSNEIRSKKTSLVIQNEQSLIDAGFYKKVIDEKAILDSYNNGDYQDLILQNCIVETNETVIPSKLRVNKRRGSNSSNFTNASNNDDVATNIAS